MVNIDYIVTAEFHIDKGPSIVHQYPSELPGYGALEFLPELMLPDQIHKREEDTTVFLLFKNRKTGHFQYLNDANCYQTPYFMYTIVRNVVDHKFQRGAAIKALTVVTRFSFFKNFQPLLMITLDLYFKDNSLDVLKHLYAAINAKSLDINQKNRLSTVKKLLITSILDLPINDRIYYDKEFRSKLLNTDADEEPDADLFMRKDLSYNSVVKFNRMNIPIRIPMFEIPDTVGDYFNPTDMNFKPNLTSLLSARVATRYLNYDLTIYGLQTPSIIVLINAILTGKKIIVLSYEKAASHIADNVFLILKLVTGGGILTGLLNNYNVFPVIDVSKIDLLEQCSSYLAGTINPFFKNNDKLWDVLYDLDANEVLLSSHIHNEGIVFNNSIISEDAKFLSNLQLSLFNYNDDLTTIQLIFRRHINEIIRILISSKNISHDLLPKDSKNYVLLLQGVGYYWNNDTTKLVEMSCYQSVSKVFHEMLFDGKFAYSLLLPNLSNELNLMIDLQHNLQKLNNVNDVQEERDVWFNILKYLISGKALEIFLLITYLIPPSSSSSLQSAAVHGGSLTIFDKNKGIELLLLNLFNYDNKIKRHVIAILTELNENFLCGWCIDSFVKSNMMYELAYDDLMRRQA